MGGKSFRESGIYAGGVMVLILASAVALSILGSRGGGWGGLLGFTPLLGLWWSAEQGKRSTERAQEAFEAGVIYGRDGIAPTRKL
jgi:hypothetical protein